MKNKSKTSTEVALSKPTVSNSINMSLNQSDMIDVVIEHQTELLSKQLEDNQLLIDVNNKNIEILKKSTMNSIISAFKSDDVLIFNKIVKQHSLTIEDHSNLSTVSYGDSLVKIGTYTAVDIDHVETYKDPYNYAKRHFNPKHINFHPIEYCNLNFTAVLGSLKISCAFKINSVAEYQKEYNSKMMPLLRLSLHLEQERLKLVMSYLEYKYGEKRIKAKIVKASLQKSEEGRGILAMLEGATNIKLLS